MQRLARMGRLPVVSAALLVFTATFSPFPGAAQTASEPVREQLLNGLTIFFWPRPGDQTILMKLRINSGAAFDLVGKDGMMALLGDALFPDPTTHEYVSEQLGGQLDVVTTHDAIEVTISGKPSEFERMVELLRNAVVTPQISTDNVAKLHEARIKRLAEKPLTVSEIADQAIAQRLLGRFPYSRSTGGSPDTVSKIDRGDLMQARERFLNADNAAIAIVGGIEKLRVMRVVRQLLGPWNKADRTVPASFRQPDPPNARVLVVNQPNAINTQIRVAVRGLSRSDRDEPLATSILARIVRDRWQAASPDLSSVSVRHEAHTLPGIFLMSATAPIASASKAAASARQIMLALAQGGPTAAELERARAEALTEISQRMSQTDSLADAWLDTVTFRAESPNTLENSIRRATAPDIQRAAIHLFKDAPIVTVAVGNSQQLKVAFTDTVDLRDAATDVNPPPNSTVPAKKP